MAQSDDYLFRVTMRGQLLIKIIDDMASAENGILKITPHEIRLNAKDDAQHCMLQTSVYRHAFTEFYLMPGTNDVQYEIDLRKLKNITSNKIFKSDNNKQKGQKSFNEEHRPTLSLFVKVAEPEHLHVCHAFTRAEYNNIIFVKRSDEVRNFEGDYATGCSWTFDSNRLHGFFKALKHDNNKYCNIEINETHMIFNGEQERSNKTSLKIARDNNILLKDAKTKSSVETDHLDGKKLAGQIKKGRPRRDAKLTTTDAKEEPLEEEETVALPSGDASKVAIKGLFVLEYLKTFTRAKNLNHKVNMYLDNGKPLLFEYPLLTENNDVKEQSVQCETCQENDTNIYHEHPKNALIGVSRYSIKPGDVSVVYHKSIQ